MHYLVITSPAFDASGRRIHGRFVATLDGRQLCISREPLLAVARILLAEGADLTDLIEMAHAHAPGRATLRGVIGQAAALTVSEGDTEGPTFRRYKAFPRRDVEPLVRLDARQAPEASQDAGRIRDGVAG